METTGAPITLFEWVERDKQSGVCRALNEGLDGEPFYPVRLHRAMKAPPAIDVELVARCEAVLGAGFDRFRTFEQWYARRLVVERPNVEPAPAAPTDAA